jgi:hypothetical protein
MDEDQIFMDIDSIDVGSEFDQAIENSLADRDALIVLIGKTWATVSEQPGDPPRLTLPNDYVRMEVCYALDRAMPIIPVLVGEAKMPSPSQLPDVLAPLTKRNALEISDTRWEYDVGRLVVALQELSQRKRSNSQT